MNKETITAGVLGLVLGIILTLAIAPMFGGRMGYMTKGGSKMMGSSNLKNDNQMMSNVDSNFIEQMIPHHESAISMANIALQKSEHPEIKQLAQNIKTSQSQEITRMRAWYWDWYGKEVPITSASMGHDMGSDMMHDNGMMGDGTDMDKLQTAQPFDKAFIEQMIPHHQMAVMMAQMLLSSTERPEMKQLAKDIIDAQTREIEQMRGWYKAWYSK